MMKRVINFKIHFIILNLISIMALVAFSKEDSQPADNRAIRIISRNATGTILIARPKLLLVDLPVYRYFNGKQLLNSFKTGIKLIKRFSL